MKASIDCNNWRRSLASSFFDLLHPVLHLGIGRLGAAFGGFHPEQRIHRYIERLGYRRQQISRRVRGRSFIVGHHSLRTADLRRERGLDETGCLFAADD